MKKITLLFILCNIIMFGQTSFTKENLPKNEIKLLFQKDEMDGSLNYKVSRNLECFAKDKSQGFFLVPVFNSDFQIKFLMTSSINIGACQENGELTFLFNDDTHFSVTSFADFSCDGNSAFQISDDDIKNLSEKEIKKIRFVNGRTGESYTHTLEGIDTRYFILLFKELNDKKIYELK